MLYLSVLKNGSLKDSMETKESAASFLIINNTKLSPSRLNLNMIYVTDVIKSLKSLVLKIGVKQILFSLELKVSPQKIGTLNLK